MTVSYNPPKDGSKFATGYMGKPGQNSKELEFTECVVLEDGNFYWIAGWCEGYSIHDYNGGRSWTYMPQLFAVRATHTDHESEFRGERTQKTGSPAEKAFWAEIKKRELVDKPINLFLNFGTRGNKCAEDILMHDLGQKELTQKGIDESVQAFAPLLREIDPEDLEKLSLSDVEEFKKALSTKSGGYKKGGYSKPLPERMESLAKVLSPSGEMESDFFTLYSFVDDLDKDTVSALVELLKLS